MSEERSLTIQREITPAIWNMLSAITESTSRGQIEKVQIAQKMLFCYENKLPLNLAFNGGLYIVNNRVEVEGNVIRAQLRRHPEYDYFIKELDEKGCTIEIGRLDSDGSMTTVGEVTFDESDAKRAGLLGKDNWQKFPADMYFNRATSRAYKRFAPDIFYNSVYVRGEIQGNDELPSANIVEAEIVPTMQELIEAWGHDLVLGAINKVGDDPLDIQKWLNKNFKESNA